MKHVSFLGAGSWGTALAILCANNGHQVTIWSKVKAETDMLKEHREHLERLPGVKLPDSIVIEEDLEKACTNQDIIVWSVASPFVRSTAQEAVCLSPGMFHPARISSAVRSDAVTTESGSSPTSSHEACGSIARRSHRYGYVRLSGDPRP